MAVWEDGKKKGNSKQGRMAAIKKMLVIMHIENETYRTMNSDRLKEGIR